MATKNKTIIDKDGKLLKQCSGPCGKFYYLEDFQLKSKLTGYRRSRCQKCRRVLEKDYREQYSKKYYIKNQIRLTKASKKRYKTHHAECIKSIKDYNQRHAEEIKEYQKTYRTNHSKEHTKYCIAYNKKRCKKDINYKLAINLRARLRHAIKSKTKTGSAVGDLGCSVAELKINLESMFYAHPVTGKTMSWDNYGSRGWHIDHIIPLVYFDLTDRRQLLMAMNYKNLQPMWAQYNMSKGGKLPDNYQEILNQLNEEIKC